MKKRVIAFLMTLVMAVCLIVPAATADTSCTVNEDYLKGTWKGNYSDRPFKNSSKQIFDTIVGQVDAEAELNFDYYDAAKVSPDGKCTGGWHINTGFVKGISSQWILKTACELAGVPVVDEGTILNPKYSISENISDGWVWIDAATGALVAYDFTGETAGSIDSNDISEYAQIDGYLDCEKHVMNLHISLKEKVREELERYREDEKAQQFMSAAAIFGVTYDDIISVIMGLEFTIAASQTAPTPGHYSSCMAEALKKTCTTPGNTAGEKCPICGVATEGSTYEIIPASHNVVTDPAKAATYTKTGLTEGSHCADCGEVFVKQQKVAKKTLAKPVISKVSLSGSTATVTWKAVTGAKSYLVQKKIGSGDWSKGVTVTGTSWKDTASKTSGSKYSYRVTAVRDTVKSSASSAVSTYYLAKVSAAPTVTAKSGSLSVKWKSVKGASKYELYRSKNGGKYTLIATTSDTGYTDKSITNGAKYQYKVRAVKTVSKTDYRGSYSAVTTTYYLTVPTISSLTNSAKGKMTVKLKAKNTKATGYEITYSTKSSFSKAKTVKITSNTTLSKAIGSLTKGSKYYVKVRAVKTVSKKTYYSAWTSSKSVTIKK